MTITRETCKKNIMQGLIARWYEGITRKSLETFRRDAARLWSVLPHGGEVLEVAPGPGFLSIEIARKDEFRVTGLDVDKTYIELARKNAARENVPVEFVLGDVSGMPFPEKSFDLLVCRAAFKNFIRPGEALVEMHRVLRPGGTGVIIDLRRDVPWEEFRRNVNSWKISKLDKWLTMLAFHHVLLKRAHTVDDLRKMLDNIDFERTEVRRTDIGMEAWFVR
jgi:ubiquinone/menaquinone biosynthesis C-methylase UbiE